MLLFANPFCQETVPSREHWLLGISVSHLRISSSLKETMKTFASGTKSYLCAGFGP
jgi:hypothetical protein